LGSRNPGPLHRREVHLEMRCVIHGPAPLVLAAALLSACAGADKAAVSAQSAGTSAARPGGEGTSMSRPAAVDLAWLDRVVEMFHARTTRKEALAALFGVDLADASSDGWSTVRRHGLVRVRIYDLPHAAIDIAVDVVFADGSRPRLADLEARLGNSRSLPRAPDDFSSGDRVAFYPQSGGSPAWVRVFAELERNGSSVRGLQIDRSIPSAVPSEPSVPRHR
jgi:hypothetical protein